MIWFILILLTFNLYAQDKILVSRKNATAFEYTPVNVGSTVSDGQIVFSGAETQTITGVDSLSTYTRSTRYMGYGIGAITDSILGISKILTIVTEDTSYSWRQSLSYTSKTGKAIYRTATISTVQSILLAPGLIDVTASDPYELTPSWILNTTRTVGWTQIWRKWDNDDSSWTKIDSVAITVTFYADSGFAYLDSMRYKIRHRINNYSDYSNVSSGIVTLPEGQFTFVPSSLNYANVDSTASDSSQTVLAINTSGRTVIISDTSGVSLPLTLILPNTLPDTVANTDTVSLVITLKRDTSGTFSQIVTLETDFEDQSFSIYANVLPGEPGTDPPDTTAPAAPTDPTATSYNSNGNTGIIVGITESTSIDKDTLHLWATAIDDIGGTFTELIALLEGTTEYDDTLLAQGQERRYKWTQEDDSSNISAFSDTVSAFVPNDPVISPPDAPSNLAGTGANLAMVLTWNDNSTDEDSFFVYIDGVKDTSVAANVTGYTQYALANNTFFEFKLSAWNSAGGESNFSNIINVATSDTATITGDGDCGDSSSSAITTPFNVVVTGYLDSLRVTWEHADPDSTFDIYIMLAALNACCGNEVPHPCYDSTNVRGSTSWTWFNPPAGVHDIKLRAKDAAGNVSIWSVADSGLVPVAIINDTTAPDAPVLVSVVGFNTGDSTYNTLAWTIDNVADGDSITIYTTTIDDTLSVYTELVILDKSITEWSDGIIDAGEVAKYKLTHQDDSSNVSDTSNAISGLVPSAPTIPPPNAPSISGVGDTLAIHLTVDTTGCGILDSIFIYKDGTKTYSITTLTKTDTPVNNNTSHSYYATVFHNTNGESNPSNVINVTTSDTTTFTYTRRYVDIDAVGGNNGTSWANAWQSLAAINIGSINPGDIVYFSGGPSGSSKVYVGELGLRGISGTADARITFRNSWDAGHNGTPILDGNGSNVVVIGNYNFSSFITLYGLHFRNGKRLVFIHAGASDITVDSCLGTDWTSFGFRTQGSSGKAIWNIIFQNNDLIGERDYGQDAFQFNESENHIIRNNFIHMRRWTASNTHADGMLALLSYNFVVTNNIVVLDSNMQGQNYILRASSEPGLTDSVIVYNNFFYYDGVYNSVDPPYTTSLFLRYKSSDGAKPPTYVVHNTFMSKGRYLQGIHTETAATIVNNINVQFVGGSSGPYYALFRGNQAIDSIRNNLLWKEPGVTGNFFQGGFSGLSNPTWAEWVAAGGTGVNSNPLFEMDLDTVYGDGQANVIGDLKSNSPAINAGEDVRSIIEGYTLWDGTQLEWVDIGKRVVGRRGITIGNPRATQPDSVTIGAYNPPWLR